MGFAIMLANFDNKIIRNRRLHRRKLMNWQVEGKIVFVDDSLLDDNLIEIRHHVVYSSQVYHLHVETH